MKTTKEMRWEAWIEFNVDGMLIFENVLLYIFSFISCNQSPSQLVSQSVPQTVCLSMLPSVSHSVIQSFSHSVIQSFSQSVSQSVSPSVRPSVSKSLEWIEFYSPNHLHYIVICALPDNCRLTKLSLGMDHMNSMTGTKITRKKKWTQTQSKKLRDTRKNTTLIFSLKRMRGKKFFRNYGARQSRYLLWNIWTTLPAKKILVPGFMHDLLVSGIHKKFTENSFSEYFDSVIYILSKSPIHLSSEVIHIYHFDIFSLAATSLS